MIVTQFALRCAFALGVAALSTVPVRAETPLERGTYLMRGIVACGNCHTPKTVDGKPIAGQELAGGFVTEAPNFHAVASNITPDQETGIGNWTDDQIVDAIRNGKRPDGTIIGPPMPIPFYREMSDSDARGIVAYLRSVKPIRNKVEKSSYKTPPPPAYGRTVTQVPDVPRNDRIAYGRYLAGALGHCLDCHTPRLPDGRNDMTRAGAGGDEFPAFIGGTVISANLTPANERGIAHWTDAQVKASIQTGMRPDRPLVLLMAFDWYKNIDDADMDALVAYLRTLQPAK